MDFSVGITKTPEFTDVSFQGGNIKSFAEFCKSVIQKNYCSKGAIESLVLQHPMTGMRIPVLRVAFSPCLPTKLDGDVYVAVLDVADCDENMRLTTEEERLCGFI